MAAIITVDEAVAEVLLEVAKYELKCAALADFKHVSQRLGWSTGLELDVPRLLTSHLPAFDRVAQHAAQAETVTSVFRRCEALDAALGELRTIQLSLITAVDQPAMGTPPRGKHSRRSSFRLRSLARIVALFLPRRCR